MVCLCQQNDKWGIVGGQVGIFWEEPRALPDCQPGLMIVRHAHAQDAPSGGAAGIGRDRCTDSVSAARVDEIGTDTRHDVVGIFGKWRTDRLRVCAYDGKADELLHDITNLKVAMVWMT